MAVLFDLVLLIAGAALILYGANFFTAGASAVAKRLGVSDFIIGMTLVSIGSSAPDLAVGVFSALKGHTQFALGNVVGSCSFDGLLVIGCLALMKPLNVTKDLLHKQLPTLLMAYLLIIICANSLSHVITRSDGMIMILFFIFILRWQLSGQNKSDSAPVQKVKMKRPWIVWLQIIGGLGALVGGGDIFVKGAAGIAEHAHISETVIGLTIVALGTSLPDLATSVVAAWKGRIGMAVGNVVGSCMMDALVVLGCSSIVCPLPLGGVNNFDLGVMLSGALLMILFALISRRRVISRLEGGIMIGVYIVYIIQMVVK